MTINQKFSIIIINFMMISVTKLNLGLQDIAMKNQKSIWYTSMSLHYGYCHTFDLSRIPELKYLTIGVETRHNPEMIFKFKKLKIAGSFIIFFHEPFGIILK